ncbi:flagellar basal body L-ring protein FlgH [Pseudoalteromonas marina]|uniref:Flagellar L-ring protein n=1 Tax=Pseudoalteromonas marina TaxID=267375 RepID=A0ABT9FCI8_9GAMM|nr:flagellar basal body L-ring protein FlgH [Pseudoalteromonas marina]MDP2564350.1 flagellar basal body L-ring protein FlgH [Pseudoalteromonas marina]
MRYIALLVFMLSGCSSVPERMDIMDYEPEFHQYDAPKKQNGSLFASSMSVSPYGEVYAKQVGDVLTVLLTESMSAKKSSASNSTKSTEANVEPLSLLGSNVTTRSLGGVDMSVGMGSDSTFKGSGSATQSNAIDGYVSVTVNRVLPNGYLYVRGEKWIQINTGDELVQVSGIVRPDDIMAGNVIESTKMADARIVYSGEGFMREASEPGWLFKVFNNSWWPL